MKRGANTILIGAFVIGAVALVVAGIILFGSRGFLSQRPVYVMYFEGSVKGLNEGAPVVFRGVRVGWVKSISLRFDPDAASVHIPVLVEIDPGTITGAQGRPEQQRYFGQLIDQGLKAQLQLQNVLTGQLVIALDFYPDRPVRLVDKDSRYPEIPTIPSSLEQFTRTIENLPIEEMAGKLVSALEGIEEAARSEDLRKSISSLNLALQDMRELISRVDSQVGPVSTGLADAIADIRQLVSAIEGSVEEMRSGMGRTLESAQAAASRAEKAFGSIEGAASGDFSVVEQLSLTLEEISAAAESVRNLADYLDRHPEALLRGRGNR